MGEQVTDRGHRHARNGLSCLPGWVSFGEMHTKPLPLYLWAAGADAELRQSPILPNLSISLPSLAVVTPLP